MINHLDLFSGIGGFALSASRVWGEEHNIHSFVEIDKFCQKILKKHWPDTPIISDIKDYKHDNTPIFLLTGGFPCQPFSCAGKRAGKEDDRYLWPEMLRIISEVHPTWLIGENVAGIINMGLDQVLSDLENEGYACQPFIIPACAVNAPHRRDRIWLIANSNSKRGGRNVVNKTNRCYRGLQIYKEWEDKKSYSDWIKTSTRICRVNDGIPNRVDRLKSLGNAIVPQVGAQIMQVIKEIDDDNLYNELQNKNSEKIIKQEVFSLYE